MFKLSCSNPPETYTTMTESNYLNERLEDQIDWYGKKSQWNQKWYKRVKKIEMTLAASIPVLMILNSDNFYIKVFIAIAGAVIAILSGIHGLYNFHENWIEYRATSETLKHEKYMYLSRSGLYTNNDRCYQSLVERVESIISHENINWAQLNKCQPQNKEKPI